MKLRSSSSAPALGLDTGAWVDAVPRVRRRVSATTVQRLIALAVVPMVVLTASLALTSDHVARPLASALYWSYLTAATMAIGLYWWIRRPASRFGPLLVVLGVLAWLVSLGSAGWPPAFNLAVLAEGPGYWLTFYVFLAFPTGRVEPAAARWLLGALAVVVVSYYSAFLLFSPALDGGGPLGRCDGPCPENVLLITPAPGLVAAATDVRTYAELAIIVGVLIVFVWRIRRASRPQRRALTAVAVTSLLYLPARFAFVLGWSVLALDPDTVDALGWGVVTTRVLMPLGLLIALVQAERFALRAQTSLLERLTERPTPEQWRATIATTLDDPELRLGYWDPATRRFRQPDGEELARPRPAAGRAWVPLEWHGREVAAMVVDETLAEDPELVRAAAGATVLAVQNGNLEGELRASAARILDAGDAERRQIGRDLHDSAQQRLVALRINLAMAAERLDRPEDQARIEDLGTEIDRAIEEVRSAARGDRPGVLAEHGVGAALAAVAGRAAMPVTIRDDWLGRHSDAIEEATYFCCLECLQNASKHAGPHATVSIRLTEADGVVGFEVADTGPGFDPAAVDRGAGLTNLADRLAGIGGTLHIDTGHGRGTRVTGSVNVTRVRR